MVLWSVPSKNAHHAPLLLRPSFLDKSVSSNPRNLGFFRFEDGSYCEIRVSIRKDNDALRSAPKSRSLMVKAMAKKNRDNSSSSSSSSSSPSPGNGDKFVPGGGDSEGSSSSDGNKSNDTASQRSSHIISDWREVRATLFRQEQAESAESDMKGHKKSGTHESKPLDLKWAHPISVPETGCVLVATEKLDGVRIFERTVVLLLRSGTRHPHEGPFGIVINRPLPKKMKHMKPANLDIATTFADCPLHFGGPLEASMFLLNTEKNSQKVPGFEEVIPGLCFGARNSLGEAAGLVKKAVLKPQDFRFFVGYAGWQLDQLREEIESDYWHVAACSSNLISEISDSADLWYEILQLMGGPYSELSRKPKKDV